MINGEKNYYGTEQLWVVNQTCKYLYEINPASVTFVKSLFVLFVKSYNFKIQLEKN